MEERRGEVQHTREIGHANTARLAGRAQRLHGGPRLFDGGIERGSRAVCRDWPVDQVQIEEVQLEVSQGLLASTRHRIRCVKIIPELGCDPEVFAADDALGKQLGQCLAHLVLVLVDRRTINVPIAALDGRLHCRLHRSRLRLPRAEPDLRHGAPVIERDSRPAIHHAGAREGQQPRE